MKREKTKIKAIIFDIGGVLQVGRYSKKPYKNHRTLGVHNSVSKKLKLSLDQYFDAIDTSYADSIEGKIPEQDALETMAKNLKISVKKLERLYLKEYKKHFKFNEQLFKQALKLKKRSYKIAILSDQWYLSKEALVNLKLKNNFNPIVISCDVGMRKPNPKIYKLIPKKLKISAKNCLFIDNQEWNIKPAKKLGMKTILFKNNKQLRKDLKKISIKT